MQLEINSVYQQTNKRLTPNQQRINNGTVKLRVVKAPRLSRADGFHLMSSSLINNQ
jgi:phosphopantetheine adenylyltransferase